MCGIAGWLGPLDSALDADATLAGMLSRIAHRGPDGDGTAVLPAGAGRFGHVRLAIIDPEGGVQPLWSHDGRSVIVFNGEIYNYRELRAQLSGTGITWRTHSDTEVLLELLLREGVAALGRVRGMYAFAFWDGEKSLALLARDPTGIKPLFVRAEGDALWFASEAKALPSTAGWRPRLDTAQLHLLLNLRYPAGGHGLLQGVEQIEPGQWLEWRERGCRRGRVPEPDLVALGPDDVRAAVIDSVRAHMVADVPVATYLSGGLDSGIVTFAAARSTEHALSTFTINAGDDPFEAQNAAASARWLGVSNLTGALAPVGLDALSWLLWHLETPKVNALQSAAVAQLAARRVKVCLSGLGGDELFLGYRAYRHLADATAVSRALGPLAIPLGRAARWILPNPGGFGELSRAAGMLTCGGNDARRYALLRNVWDGSLPHARIYGPRMLDAERPDAIAWVDSRWDHRLPATLAMARFEWSNKMVDDLLWQEDRTSMACGLEVRVPFVDQYLHSGLADLAERNARQPGTKHLLRSAFTGDLPATLLSRPKSGFQLDIAHVLDPLFGAAIEAWLSPTEVRRHGLFNPAFVTTLLRMRRTRGHRWHFFLLLLMALSHRWLDLFEDGAALPVQRPTLTLDNA